MKKYLVEFETATLYDSVKVEARSRSHAKQLVKAHYNGFAVVTGVQPCKVRKPVNSLILALTGCIISVSFCIAAAHLYINGLGF